MRTAMRGIWPGRCAVANHGITKTDKARIMMCAPILHFIGISSYPAPSMLSTRSIQRDRHALRPHCLGDTCFRQPDNA